MARRAHAERSMHGAVLFDLDNTLIRGDLARWYLLHALKRRPIRLLLATLVAPVVLPGFLSSHLRRYSTSTFFWIATVGRRPHEVFRSFRLFAREFVADGRGPKLRQPAVTQLRAHATGNLPVAVVTGCASPLAHAFVLALGLPHVRIVGSVAGWRAGGLIIRMHCYAERKVACAIGAGVPPPWTTCYTDSAKDLPLLERSRTRVLVCPSTATRRRVEQALAGDVQIETWD